MMEFGLDIHDCIRSENTWNKLTKDIEYFTGDKYSGAEIFESFKEERDARNNRD